MRLGLALALAGPVGIAAAQEIELVGEAWLGLGYNIDNEGEPTGEERARTVSSVEFGVEMEGETDGGIVFGAEILADEAKDGEGGGEGQTEGSVFVAGAFGTLSFGDVDGADAVYVGDLNEIGLTCLGCQNETPFISNGGDFGEDAGSFAENPFARPTVRYDYERGDFGLSLSSNRDLTDIGIGAGYARELEDGSFAVGLGYYDFAGFTAVDPPGLEVGDGNQWSAALAGEAGGFTAKLVLTRARSGDARFDTAGVGLGADLEPWSVDAYYTRIVDAGGALGALDELQSYGIGGTYDLGGDTWIEGGLASVWSLDAAEDGFVVADFGIGMEF